MGWHDLLRGHSRRRPADREIDRELRAHLDLETEEQQEAGLAPDEASRAARVLFGEPSRIKEDVRAVSRWMWWERLVQDLRYALRMLRRTPAFSLTAVLSLALGIGANTAIFTLVNAALLRPLPVGQPDELALLSSQDGTFSYPTYTAIRDGSQLLADVMAVSSLQPAMVRHGGATAQATVKMVSGTYFTVLEVPAALGRVLTRQEETEPVAVISRTYWRRQFGESPDTLGQLVRVNGAPFTIVGVMPASFFGETPGESPDIWTSMALQPPDRRNERGFTWLQVMGRLRPGATLPGVEGEANAVTQSLEAAAGGTLPDARISVTSGRRGVARLRDRFRDPLSVLMVTVGIVLLIACANLASLLLTRGAARRAELTTRYALGAGRARIVRQLMTESLVVALLGGALGLAFSLWGSSILLRLTSAAGQPLAIDLWPDGSVLLFTLAAALSSAVIFGVAPAVRGARDGTTAVLLTPGRGVIGRTSRGWLRDAFIVAEVALSLMLLTGGTLFVRTLRNLEAQDLGVRPENMLVASLLTEGGRPASTTLAPELLERIRAIPGVESATVAFPGTISNAGGGVNGLEVDGYTPRTPEDQRARAVWVGPDYFRTAGIRLRAGRDISTADSASAQRVAVVNRTMADFYFTDGDALGRRFRFNKNEYEIVGISADAKHTNLRAAVPRMVYFALLQGGGGMTSVELRTSTNAATAATALRRAVGDVDSRMSVGEVATLAERIGAQFGRERLVADLAAVFGGLTLLLSAIGVYGTLAYAAATRTKEIGVRLALGSGRAAVVWMVMRGIAVQLAAGLVLGLAGALAAGTLIASMLFGLESTDIVSLGIAIGLLTSVALVAAALPSIRASRLDPARVLRE